MPTTASRITSTGTLFVSGQFDEVTTTTVKLSTTTYNLTLLDEVTYNPASGVTTNLFANSQAFSNAIWITTQATKTSTSVQSPIGTLDAVLITEANDLGVPSSHGLRYQPYSWTSGQQYTYSVFAKAGIASAGIALVLQATAFVDGIERNANYNFSTVSTTKNTTGSMGTSIVDLNNGWYRCSLSFTVTNTGQTVGLQMRNFNGSGSFYASTGTGTVYLWGVQLQTGSTATTYVATSSTGLPFTPYNGIQKITRNGEIYVSGIFDEVTGIL